MKNLHSTLMVALFASAITVSGCKQNDSTTPNEAQESAALFPKGDPVPASNFKGEAYLQPLLKRDSINNFVLGSVTFEPGARTNWHTHPRGQVLIVTEGEGLNQEMGKPVQRLKKGDVVNIPANVLHWHGATAHSKMVHIAITNYKDDSNAEWKEPVTDAQYGKANQE